MSIAERVASIQGRIAAACARAARDPRGVTLVAVSKTFPPAAIAEAYRAGLRHFGENRVQEAQEKAPQVSALGATPVWHLIGHLQTNKARAAAGLFAIIHSVDSVRNAEALSRYAQGTLPVFLEVNVAGEANKSGVAPEDARSLWKAVQGLAHIPVLGLMTVAPLAADPEAVRPVFRRLRELRDDLGLAGLSMGMTDDFEVAIEEGATHVRIGRAIFGARPA
ncbi:MAG: YggS family pyridoxal phosphate-dependent enzyme [Dehalococcoidia bacterium]|nr:YggS family pyridoxal phosphate-dependent enzyme [Dehalococcoidia bacterium]